MKKHVTLFRAVALLLALVLTLGLAGCAEKPAADNTPPQGSTGKLELPEPEPDANPEPEPDANPEPEPEPAPAPDGPYVYSEVAQVSIDSLYNAYWNELFAASYLGYREEGDTRSTSEWLWDNYPLMPTYFPFTEEIPQADTIGEYGDLYCIVPMDESVSFSVKGVEWELLGNGIMPHYSDVLYTPQVSRPFLLYVTHGEWPLDEANMVLEFVKQNGFVGTWFPSYDAETGLLATYDLDIALDYAALYNIGCDVPQEPSEEEPVGDMEWLPPTELGLAGTTWYSDNRWILEFGYDASAEDGMVLYQPVVDEAGTTTFVPYYQGSWWMEDDKLCLGVYEGHCPFPLLISPSGEEMVIMQAEDGSVLPFFQRGETTVGMTLSYG